MTMQETAALYRKLAEAGIVLFVEGDELRYHAPRGALTPADKTAIATALTELRELAATLRRRLDDCHRMPPCRRMAPCEQPINGRPCTLAEAPCVECGGPLEAGRTYVCARCQP